MVLIADTVVGVAHSVERDFSILVRQRDQFAARVLLRRAALVGIDMGVIAAKHCVKRPVQCLQAQHVGAGAVEGKEHVNAGAEMLLKLRDRRAGVRIVSIGHYVALVGAGNRLEDLRMHSGIVVAGKTADRLGNSLWHTKTM